jgi:hypothetical protein
MNRIWVKRIAFTMLAAGICGCIGWSLAEGGIPGVKGASAFAAVSADGLRDIRGHWGEAAIGQAVGKGYVDGYEDQTFKPDREVSRAEFVKMAVTALKVPVSGATSGADWYMPYVHAAVGVKVHQWSDFTTGDWNTPMSRSEMARMAVRATGEETDEDKKWMYLATKAGLIQGTDDTGTLDMEGSTTRAQSVTIIERILSVKAGQALPADKHAVSRAEVEWHKTNIFSVMPQYFGKLHPSSKWNPDDLFIESGDGLYRAELDQLIAIDLEDPNDPFLGEVPPVETLKWYNYESSASSPHLTSGMPAYLLYYKGRTAFNKDSTKYGQRTYAPMSVFGAVTEDYEARSAGNLVGLSSVFKNKDGDMPVFILPKVMKTDGGLEISLYTPSIPGNKQFRKTILWSVTPKLIGD